MWPFNRKINRLDIQINGQEDYYEGYFDSIYVPRKIGLIDQLKKQHLEQDLEIHRQNQELLKLKSLVNELIDYVYSKETK